MRAYVLACIMAQLDWESRGQRSPERGKRVTKEARETLAGVGSRVLRDAIEDVDTLGLDAYATNEVVTWLNDRATRIEKGANA